MGMTSNSGNSGDGITIGGFHFPDVTNIFKHHPSRPTPHGNPSNPPPVPTTSISGYAKYLAAGGICATITHVPTPQSCILLCTDVLVGHDDTHRCSQNTNPS
jgi:hypothetical protein